MLKKKLALFIFGVTLVSASVSAVLPFTQSTVYAEEADSCATIRDNDDRARCEAVAECIENGGTRSECTSQYNTCISDGGSAEECASQTGSAGGESSCQVEGGLGWVLCPVLNTMATINDWSFQIIQRLLITPPMVGDAEEGVYEVWSMMRTVANAAFVIVFVILIYSQITGMGLSNYGIKKMLPKLVIGAILVNTSFWLTAAAIDLSNIFGQSIYSLLDNVIDVDTFGVEADFGEGANWGTITTMVLLGGAGLIGGVMAGVSILAPLALGALFMLIGLVFILTFRNAVVFMLVVISPLAMVAYMLPNTDGLFKAWFKIFKVVLMIYPAVALVMGMSALAGGVIYNAAGDDVIMQMIGVAMPAMGIFAAIMLAKTMGSIMQRFGISNPLSPALNAAKSGAKTLGQRQDHNIKAASLKFANNQTRKGHRNRAFIGGVIGGGLATTSREKNKTAQSRAEAQQAIYEENGGIDGNLGEIQGEARTNRIVTSAAEGASKQADLEKFANSSDEDLNKMADRSPEMIEVLKQQRAGAAMEAARGLSGEFSTIKDTDALKDEYKKAVLGYKDASGTTHKPNAARARAAINQFDAMKSKGADALSEATVDIEKEISSKGGFSETQQRAYGEAVNAVKSTGIKNYRADTYSHYASGGIGDVTDFNDKSKYLESKSATGKAYMDLSSSQRATQTAKHTRTALASGKVSQEDIAELLGNKNVEPNISADTKTVLQEKLNSQQTPSAQGSQTTQQYNAVNQPTVTPQTSQTIVNPAPSGQTANPAPTNAVNQPTVTPQTSQTIVNPAPSGQTANPAPTTTSSPASSPSSSVSSGGKLTIHRDTTEPPKVSPAQGRTSPPAGTSNYVQRDSGLIVPPDNKS